MCARRPCTCYRPREWGRGHGLAAPWPLGGRSARRWAQPKDEQTDSHTQTLKTDMAVLVAPGPSGSLWLRASWTASPSGCMERSGTAEAAGGGVETGNQPAMRTSIDAAPGNRAVGRSSEAEPTPPGPTGPPRLHTRARKALTSVSQRCSRARRRRPSSLPCPRPRRGSRRTSGRASRRRRRARRALS